MKNITPILIIVATLILNSCGDYLDVVPDNVGTLDHSFTNKESAEKFLFTCYSYLPNPADVHNNPEFLCGFENWTAQDGLYYFQLQGSQTPFAYYMRRDGQNSNSPFFNFWSGGNGGSNYWIAIRDCNIFLDNVHKPSDVEEDLRKRWIAEVKFLKAYYHYYILRMYGPIPIMKENVEVSANPELVQVFREPVDDVVNYIVELLDEASIDLPDKIQNETEELGRITKPIALAVKAKALLLNASDIFNGNSYYANIVDSRGINLFPTSFDASKWEKAADAAKEAIDTAESAGIQLYEYDEYKNYSDSTKLILGLRFVMTKKWNKELIWGSTRSTEALQQVSAVRTKSSEIQCIWCVSMLSPTLTIAERFYTNHGLPIDQDKTWDYDGRYSTYKVGTDERFYMKEGYTTAKLNHKREPRYYSSLIFDGALYHGKGNINVNEDEFYHIQMLRGRPGGMVAPERYSITGYLPKKVINVETLWDTDNKWITKNYSFPIIRLADLYLMYAEALNEVAFHENTNVPTDVYTYLDMVRKRAGLEGVIESWEKYSFDPERPKTPKGMREIIRQERLNELVFEGQGYWDLLRWKKAEVEFKKPVLGWNVKGDTPETYYEVTEIFEPTFYIKDYLNPISLGDLDRNGNLIQNFGW